MENEGGRLKGGFEGCGRGWVGEGEGREGKEGVERSWVGKGKGTEEWELEQATKSHASTPTHRLSSLLLLSHLLPLLTHASTPPHLQPTTLHTLLRLLLTYFPTTDPANYTTATYTPPHITSHRITLLQALSMWLAVPSFAAHNPEATAYVMRLAGGILEWGGGGEGEVKEKEKGTINPFLRTAILNLFTSLPPTPRTKTYLSHYASRGIDHLTSRIEGQTSASASSQNLAQTGLTILTEEDESSSRPSSARATTTSSAKDEKEKEKEKEKENAAPLHTHLQRGVYRFWNVHPPRPSDEILLQILSPLQADSTDDLPAAPNTVSITVPSSGGPGYTYRRVQYLLSLARSEGAVVTSNPALAPPETADTSMTRSVSGFGGGYGEVGVGVVVDKGVRERVLKRLQGVEVGPAGEEVERGLRVWVEGWGVAGGGWGKGSGKGWRGFGGEGGGGGEGQGGKNVMVLAKPSQTATTTTASLSRILSTPPSLSLTRTLSTLSSPPTYPPSHPLTFNLSPPILLFHRYPFTKLIFLQNKSLTMAQDFRIQTWPPGIFACEPSCGVVGRGESCSVVVRFLGRGGAGGGGGGVKGGGEVGGFLRVRSGGGWCGERIALKSHPTPPLRLHPSTPLKFPTTPKTDTRTLTYTLHNLLPIENPCVMVIRDSSLLSTSPTGSQKLYTSSPFKLPQSVITLGPKERKVFNVIFAPTEDHAAESDPDPGGRKCEAELVVVSSISSEILSLPISGIVGESIRVLETKLDFGPTDIYYGSVARGVNLWNLTDRDVKVVWEGSSDEIWVSTAKSGEKIRGRGGTPTTPGQRTLIGEADVRSRVITLEPYEKKKLRVTFLSHISGTRNETLTFRAPSSTPHTIECTAFSGPMLTVPLMEHISFPATRVTSKSSIHLPLTNLSATHTVICTITVPTTAPITFRLMDPEQSNRRTGKDGVIGVELKGYEGPESVGCLLTIPPTKTAVVEVTFSPSTWGSFRVPLTVMMTKPRKWSVGVWILAGVGVNEVYLGREKPVDHLRRFFERPGLENATGVMKRTPPPPSVGEEGSGGGGGGGGSKSSKVFELDPLSQTIFGAAVTASFEDVYEFVTLTNTTSTVQAYRIVLSQYFVTDVPLDGEMDALTSVEVPVRLNLDYFNDISSKDIHDLIALGSITVFDEDNTAGGPGWVTTALHGVYGDLVSLQARALVEEIKYPATKVMEKISRRIFLRNRTSLDIMWEGRMTNVGMQGIGLQADGIPMIVPTSSSSTDSPTGGVRGAEWCPFTLSAGRLNLKPYEWHVLEISFQATGSGEWRGKMFMEYVDPVTHVVGGEKTRGKVKRSLRSLLFRSRVGVVDLGILPDGGVSLGDVGVGEAVVKSVGIVNQGGLETAFGMVGSETVGEVMGNGWSSVGKNIRVDVPVVFRPLSVMRGSFSEGILVTFGNVTRCLPVWGAVGVSLLTSSLGPFLKLPGDFPTDVLPPHSALHTVSLGYVSTISPKSRVIKIKNAGTFDLTIKSISTPSGDRTLSYRFLADSSSGEMDLTVLDAYPPASTDFAVLRPDDPDPDFDELDFRVGEERGERGGGGGMGMSRQSSVGSMMGGAVGGVPRRKRYKSISYTAGMPSFVQTKVFPVRVPALGSVEAVLRVGGDEKGPFVTSLRVEMERSNGESETYVVWVTGNIQPPLQVWERKLEFGVQAVHMRQRNELKFTNTGSVPLCWSLVQTSIDYNPVTKFDPLPLPKDQSTIPNPLAIFPMTGKLPPGSTQSVDVIFTPSLPQYECTAHMMLNTEDFASTPVIIHGVGASSKLVVDMTSLDFGVLRVGTKRSYRIRLRNRGILQLKYFIECSDTQFSADPEQGLLEGDGATDLTVRFVPTSVGNHKAHLRILPHSQEGYSLDAAIVTVTGMGGYPELVVLTRNVDFGTALFMTPNRKPIRVENRGAADAHIVFSCHHPAIRLEGHDPRGSVTIGEGVVDADERSERSGYGRHGGKEEAVDAPIVLGPYASAEIWIVYTPTVVETLDIKVFLRSSDSRGDYFMVGLKGSVGVPKLVLDPPDILEKMDFGVCAVNGVYKKVFTMSNQGNISLLYSMTLEAIRTVLADDVTAPSKPTTPKRPILTIEPNSGTLAVGEIATATLTFVPPALADYEYAFTLNYEFRTSNAIIKGVGGRAILSIDSPLTVLDFGVCRLNRKFRKAVAISNTGNLGVDYHLRPEPRGGDWHLYDDEIVVERFDGETQKRTNEEEEARQTRAMVIRDRWTEQLAAMGFHLVNPDGYCKPHAKTELVIEYAPTVEDLVNMRLRVFFGDQHEDVDIRGRAAIPRLLLFGANNEPLGVKGEGEVLDLGVHPVMSEYMHTLQLVNEGPFGIDYFVQPMGTREFDVRPLRGFIEPDSSIPLRLYFRPTTESKFHTNFKVLWEREPIHFRVLGSGGIGKLEIAYLEEKDMALNGLDFGMVPFNSAAEKHFLIHNVGMVEISVRADVDNEEYVITPMGDPFPIESGKKGLTVRSPNKRVAWNWYSSFKMGLQPQMGQEFAVRFVARSPTTSAGNIHIKSECGNYLISMRGKGGTIQISHKGDLSFGDIASNFTYSRKISVVNNGSIPATLTAEWLVVGHSEQPSAMIRLTDTYSALDPRSQWARQTLLKERGETDDYAKLSSKDHWRLIQLMIRKTEVIEDSGAGQVALSKMWGSTLSKIKAMTQKEPAAVATVPLPDPPSHASTSSVGATESVGTTSSTNFIQPFERGTSRQSSSSMLQRRGVPAHYSAHFKRRQMFFHLITTTQLTSQVMPTTRPYIKVDPPISLLPSYGETILNVEINMSTEDTFLATLVLKASVPNTPVHEISLTATPKAVNIVCDDTRILNFHRQPLHETEVLTRTFTNVGHKDFNFRIVNPNSFLTAVPAKGILRVGETVTVTFNFRPTDESVQTGDVVFEPDCSQPVRLKFNGGGGYAKASLAKYRRFDFGYCMIGKDTVSYLPITNEGNAFLHLTKFDLMETDTFFRGLEWPTTRVSLFPGKTYNLPIVFNPHEESPAPGRLTIGTNTESWDIELIGLGREAVLIVSKVALEFAECLIGNTYEQKLGLKNVGDVNYPVTFKLEKEFKDVEFIPTSLVINPYTESFVTIAYTPTKETKHTVVLTVSSPYSTHIVPLVLHAGTAILEFSSTDLDFGMFERTTRPTLPVTIRNIGTVRTSFVIRDVVRPSMFHITPAKGLLYPGRQADVAISHIKHEVASFKEHLVVRTDLIDKLYHLTVRGQCEEAVLHPDEFNMLNLGICPVLEPTTKPLTFTNYGRYPLDWSIKSAYPLKVVPSSGIVPGGETGTINISWSPSGGYELRTQVSMVTNIGVFNIVVRGKAAFPEMVIKNMYLDFGVCAVGYTYRETFSITNKGKVPISFTIPPLRETSYTVTMSHGVLEPKETKDVDVMFKPAGVGRFANTFIVECKGINYKEVVVIGVGGQMKLEISPSVLQMGRCPCDLRVYHGITLINHGDVTLYADFPDNQSTPECEIIPPASIAIKPNQSVRCLIGITAKTVACFRAKLKLTTKEKGYDIPLEGVGLKIVLSERSKKILEEERLPVLAPTDPLSYESPTNDIDMMLRRLGKLFRLDFRLVEIVSILYPCANVFMQGSKTFSWVGTASRLVVSKDMLTLPKSLTSEGSKFIELEDDVSGDGMVGQDVLAEGVRREGGRKLERVGSPAESRALEKGGSIAEELFVMRSSSSVGARGMQRGDSTAGAKTPTRTGSTVEGPALQRANTSADGRTSQRVSTADEPRGSVHTPAQTEQPASGAPINPTLPVQDTASRQSTPIAPSITAQSSQSSSVVNIPAPPIPTNEELAVLVSDDQDEGEELDEPSPAPSAQADTKLTGDRTTPSTADKPTDKGLPPLPPKTVQTPSSIQEPLHRDEPTPHRDPREEDLKSFKERISLAQTLDDITSRPHPPDIASIDVVMDQFMDMKQSEYARHHPPPPEDAVIHQIVEYAHLKVDQIDIDPIIQSVEPDVEVDLGLVIDRPPPFGKDEVKQTVKLEVKLNKKEYMVFLPLLRRERNARTVDFYRAK
ncbi:hypothetical protein HDV00_004834 [Rhizophlyctis rosea]|nr:hypothetical protein HDV00_004834 [Rhizophlyctis rosea]